MGSVKVVRELMESQGMRYLMTQVASPAILKDLYPLDYFLLILKSFMRMNAG